MSYSIRPYRDGDAEVLADIIKASIEGIGPRHYSADQVAAWSARHPDAGRFRERAAKGDKFVIAVDERDLPVAYAILEDDGHLDHLYCHPEHTRQGLADTLLAEAETIARSLHAQRLYTEASELARAAFERAGYAVQHRREFEIEGVPIHNYAMEKPLI